MNPWTIRRLLAAAVLGLCFACPGVTMAADQVGWEDLAPPFDESKDPMAALTREQQDYVLDVVWARKLRQDGYEDEDVTTAEAKARRTLEAAGLSPDGLLAQVDAYEAYVETLNGTLVEDLDGREIRIPGYALPLETSDTAVTEFLLVPYVGACIHVPPPPPNQIVHVRFDEGFESEGLFTPVWVTGRISTRPQSLALSLVDGTSDVSTGYSLLADEIEPYEF